MTPAEFADRYWPTSRDDGELRMNVESFARVVIRDTLEDAASLAGGRARRIRERIRALPSQPAGTVAITTGADQLSDPNTYTTTGQPATPETPREPWDRISALDHSKPATPPPQLCAAWCGTPWNSHAGHGHGAGVVAYQNKPERTHCYCTPACRDAGKPLNPRAGT